MRISIGRAFCYSNSTSVGAVSGYFCVAQTSVCVSAFKQQDEDTD